MLLYLLISRHENNYVGYLSFYPYRTHTHTSIVYFLQIIQHKYDLIVTFNVVYSIMIISLVKQSDSSFRQALYRTNKARYLSLTLKLLSSQFSPVIYSITDLASILILFLIVVFQLFKILNYCYQNNNKVDINQYYVFEFILYVLVWCCI